ncbi:hypothetical protein H0H92_012748 [Tricholoma furcatifolium]|nr:hypothetical protein H0H92_012748 [Tricholoma furcatifolium]
MAIATLELCFMNLAMFDWNIKICKAEAAQDLCQGSHHQLKLPADSVAGDKPSNVELSAKGVTFNILDARTNIICAEQARNLELTKKRHLEEICNNIDSSNRM